VKRGEGRGERREGRVNDDFFHEINTESEAKMKELVQNAVTARIFKSENIPNFGWDWQHGALHSYSDAEEPQRYRFDGELDYSLDDESLPTSALVGMKCKCIHAQLSSFLLEILFTETVQSLDLQV
jgi:hypothetical protein